MLSNAPIPCVIELAISSCLEKVCVAANDKTPFYTYYSTQGEFQINSHLFNQNNMFIDPRQWTLII